MSDAQGHLGQSPSSSLCCKTSVTRTLGTQRRKRLAVKKWMVFAWKWQWDTKNACWKRQTTAQRQRRQDGKRWEVWMDHCLPSLLKVTKCNPLFTLQMQRNGKLAAQCFRDGRWPHIGPKFNATESNENWTGGTWDVVDKLWKIGFDVKFTQLASQCIKVGYFMFCKEKVEKNSTKTTKLPNFHTL